MSPRSAGPGAPGQGWLECTASVPAERVGPVLRDGVGPLLAGAGEGGLRWLFLRELAGVGPDAPAVAMTIQVEQSVAAGGPAPAWPDWIGDLGRRLGQPGLAVRPAEQVPLAGAAFTGEQLAPVVRTFLAEVTPTLLTLVRPDPARRAGLLSGALELMIGHLPAVGRATAPGAGELAGELGGAPLSFLSFRSHAEAFLAGSRDPDAARAALDRRYEAIRGTVQARVSAVLAGLGNRTGHAGQADGGDAVSAAALGWYRAVRAAKPGVSERFGAGQLRPAPVPDHAGDRMAGFATSSFHGTLAAAPDLRQFLGEDPAFLAVRLLTSLLYLSLHNIGVSLVERYFLCHAVSRACESLFNVDAVALLARLANRPDLVPVAGPAG